MEDLTAENSDRAKPSEDTSILRPASSIPAGPSATNVRTGASDQLLCLATLASAAAAAVWVIAAAMTASHGLDATDEGFYLLSYRWWNTELRTFTGAQFVYGPVFELLGHNIAGLRLVRLLTIIAANAAFGWTFMGWLRLRRPDAAATRWWEAAGTAAIVACGGMNYSWLPLSPGYNDLSLLGALLAAAVVLRMAADVDRGRRVPMWVPLSIGPVALAMLVAKWSSSGLTLMVVVIVGAVILVPAGVRQAARVTAWALVGLVFSAIFVQLFIIRLDQAIPQMIDTNKLVAAGSNSLSDLFQLYRLSFGGLINRTARSHKLLLITAVAAVALRNKLSFRVLAVVGVITAVLSFKILFHKGAFTGGNVNIRTYSVGLTLVLAITLIVAMGTLLDRRRPFRVASSLRREGWRDTAIVVMLLALPLTQAAGTGNPIYFIAFNCLSAWAALIILVLTGIEGAPTVARALTAVAAAGAVLMSSAIGTSALLLHPYRTSRPSLSNAVVFGVPALRSVTVDPQTAAMYGPLHRVLAPYLTPGGGTYMMGFIGRPGVIFALDGRSVGEAWYSDRAPQRTVAGIRAACPDGKGPWGSRPPILLISPITSGTETAAALRACGLDLARDYRQLGNPTKIKGLRIFVGTSELAAHGNGAR
jgi:hypothetical protein